MSMATDMLITGNDCQLASDFEEREAELARRMKLCYGDSGKTTGVEDASEEDPESDEGAYELPKDGKGLHRSILMEVSTHQDYLD
jgi:hypothetical protein